MYETDGPLVGDSEKATAKKRVVPVSRTRICHVTRPATPLSPLSKIHFLPVPYALSLPLCPPFVTPRRPVDLLIYLAIYIHVILHRGYDGDY